MCRVSQAEVGNADRVLRLAGAHNIRDLGGLETIEGERTRSGRIYRGDHIWELAPDDLLILERLGLRTIVDLRSSVELDREGHRWEEHGIRWVNCPFSLGDVAPLPLPGSDYVEAYLGFLDGDPSAVVRAASTLMDAGNHPVLFHCAAGKDRTGVLAALLLDVLGVQRPAIAIDYALTAAGLPLTMARLSQTETYRDLLAGTTAEEHLPTEDVIVAFLDSLDRRDGGSLAWLFANGLDDCLVAPFRQAMLHPRATGLQKS
jgi:protein-tyrosine phosphatase